MLVTGSSGHLGQVLLKKLEQNNKTIVALYKTKIPETGKSIFPVCCDIHSRELLMAPLRGVQTVVHLAWKNEYEKEKSKVPLEKILTDSYNIKGLKSLISAAEEQKVDKFIFISANGASMKAESFFLKEKYISEYLLINSKIPNVCILRPPIIISRDFEKDRFISAIKNIMRIPGMYPVPSDVREISAIFEQDMVEIIYDKISHPQKFKREIEKIVSNEKIEVPELFRFVASKVIQSSKFAIKGSLADSIMRILENGKDQHNFNLRHFLTISQFENEELNNDLGGKYSFSSINNYFKNSKLSA